MSSVNLSWGLEVEQHETSCCLSPPSGLLRYMFDSWTLGYVGHILVNAFNQLTSTWLMLLSIPSSTQLLTCQVVKANTDAAGLRIEPCGIPLETRGVITIIVIKMSYHFFEHTEK